MMIKNTEAGQFQSIMEFYNEIIDWIGDSKCSAGWKKGIYPEPDFVRESIRKGELFVAVECRSAVDAGEEAAADAKDEAAEDTKDEVIAGAMVLNHEYNEAYRNIEWPTEADDNEILVIHILGVRPSFMGKGVATQLVRFAFDLARENKLKAIRLDVLKGNLIAEKMYPDLGFRYIKTIPMYYEDTGWQDFELYEYPVRDFHL